MYVVHTGHRQPADPMHLDYGLGYAVGSSKGLTRSRWSPWVK